MSLLQRVLYLSFIGVTAVATIATSYVEAIDTDHFLVDEQVTSSQWSTTLQCEVAGRRLETTYFSVVAHVESENTELRMTYADEVHRFDFTTPAPGTAYDERPAVYSGAVVRDPRELCPDESEPCILELTIEVDAESDPLGHLSLTVECTAEGDPSEEASAMWITSTDE